MFLYSPQACQRDSWCYCEERSIHELWHGEASMRSSTQNSLYVVEMKEFSSFPARTQRYIRISLDLGLDREPNVEKIWARDPIEIKRIKEQKFQYFRLDEIRENIPTDSGLDKLAAFLQPTITLSAFDLSQGCLDTFSSYRFLYERLLGPAVRGFLVSTFCAAVGLPLIHPERRKVLFQSISEAAATAPGWSERPPHFYPEWVDKVELSH